MNGKLTLGLISTILLVCSCNGPQADIVLINGEIYTLEENHPWASGIVITGDTITAVLEGDDEVEKYIGPATRVIDLKGKFVVPGFIDAHTHMDGFGAQQNDINLMPVTDNAGLRRELQRVVDILDEIRAGLRIMNERGITEIHDISSERQMLRYAKLHERGELTVRIWGRPHIQDCQSFKDRGIEMNTHPVTGERDYVLRYGAYKGYYDGLMGSHQALLFEPYSDRPETYGRYRTDTSDDPRLMEKNPEKFYNFSKIAFADGFSINTHAIGSRGISELLDDYERQHRF